MRVLFVTHDGVSHEPLGIMYVSAALKRAGHETKACMQSRTMETVASWQPDFVAFQVITGDQERWGSVAAAVKRKYPKIRTIFGGPHFLFFSKDQQKEADIVIRGDGEEAIVNAVEGRPWQDLKAIENLDSRANPDRILLYNDDFPGIKNNVIRNIIACQGCLGYNTLITLASGIEKPIQNINENDEVLSYDVEFGRFVSEKVKNVYRRVANDIYEIQMENGAKIEITGEHPVWTNFGWKRVDQLDGSELIYAKGSEDKIRMRIVREDILSQRERTLDKSESVPVGRTQEAWEFLFPRVQAKEIWNDQYACMVQNLQEKNNSSINWNSENVLSKLPFEIKKHTGHGKNNAGIYRESKTISIKKQSNEIQEIQEDGQFEQNWNEKSNEETRSSRKNGENFTRKTRKDVFEIDETKTQGWENVLFRTGIRSEKSIFFKNEIKESNEKSIHCKESSEEIVNFKKIREAIAAEKELLESLGDETLENIQAEFHSSGTYGKQNILDRTLHIRYEKKSRFCSQEQKTKIGNLIWRKILASEEGNRNTKEGLYQLWMESSISLAGIVTKDKKNVENREGISFSWNCISKITFMGRGLVYNFTVCPTHTYIAAGLVVHNCPYKCSYCFNSNKEWQKMVSGNRLRYHSPDWLIEEIEKTFTDYGGDLVSFQDDIFGIDMKWLEEFVRKYQRLRIPFFAQLRPRLITEDRIKLLKEANIHIVSFAIESGNEKTRREILDREEPNAVIRKGCELLHRYGIKFRMQNLLGLPVDDPLGDALETLRFNMEMRPTLSWGSLLQSYPGTEIANYVVKKGLVKTMDDLIPLVNATFFDETSLPVKDAEKITRLHKYWSATVRWQWLYPIVRILINFDFGRKFTTAVFEKSKNYINGKEYWRIDGKLMRHVSMQQPMDRLGGELVRNPEKETQQVCA